MDASKFLYKHYKKTGNSARALEMYELYIKSINKIKRKKNIKALLQQQYKYEYEKKEMADSIRNAESTKVINAEIEAQKAQLKQEETFRNIMITGMIILLIISSVIYYFFKKTNDQKKKIEVQKKKISDRIQYSQKVQKSLLPSIQEMKNAFADLFVYYDPKDVVSGDFYWFKTFEQYIIIACVDCTGHGVPGGFMSTLGKLLMDKVTENKQLNTAEILSGLSKEIIGVLRQHEGGPIQDGMDISLCLIDKNDNTLEFSGARNGIIVVKDEKLTRYKADMLPVGGSYMKRGKPLERNFKSHKIELSKKDWVFMYTDGFIDQLGGPDKTIMNNKKFEDNISKLCMLQSDKERKELLKTAVDDWRGNVPRTDDILLMGFKLN